MFVTRIRVHDLNGESLFNAVLLELPDLCDSFTCYPSEGMFIANGAPTDIADLLRMRGINTEHVVCKML